MVLLVLLDSAAGASAAAAAADVLLVGPARCFFFQAEDGIRDCLLSRGLGDVYKRQVEF